MQPNPTKEELTAALEGERAAFTALLPRISDEQWSTLQREDGWTIHDIVGHVADSSYGLAWLIENGSPGGAVDVNARNAERRERMRQMPRSELEKRVGSGFDAALAALDRTDDLSLPGPFGPDRSKGQWFQIIALHNGSHRVEIEQLLSQ